MQRYSLMKKFHKKGLILLVITMVLTVTSITFFATPNTSSTSVKYELAAAQGDSYKLVFRAMTPSTIMMLETIFSFDNSVIRPVRASDQSEVRINDGGSSVLPFLIKAEDVQEGNTFQNLPVEWKIDGNRTAFRYGLYANPGIEAHYMVSDSNYVDMFEFYFELQPGKTPEDIDGDTFRFENGLDANNFVVMISPIPENGLGTHLKEAVGLDHFWGGVDQERYPDSINILVNQTEQFSPMELADWVDPSDQTSAADLSGLLN